MSYNIAHLRVFSTHAHTPAKLMKKLDDRSEKCIFIGYNEQSKAYTLCSPVTKKEPSSTKM